MASTRHRAATCIAAHARVGPGNLTSLSEIPFVADFSTVLHLSKFLVGGPYVGEIAGQRGLVFFCTDQFEQILSIFDAGALVAGGLQNFIVRFLGRRPRPFKGQVAGFAECRWPFARHGYIEVFDNKFASLGKLAIPPFAFRSECE